MDSEEVGGLGAEAAPGLSESLVLEAGVEGRVTHRTVRPLCRIARLLLTAKRENFTRLMSGFGRKIENLRVAVALCFAHRNLACPHRTLNGLTPAEAE